MSDLFNKTVEKIEKQLGVSKPAVTWSRINDQGVKGTSTTETTVGAKSVAAAEDKDAELGSYEEIEYEDWPTDGRASTYKPIISSKWNSGGSYKECHKVYDPEKKHSPIFTIGKSKIYGGRALDLNECSSWKLVIDCSGGQFRTGNYDSPVEYKDMEKYVVPVITLPWSDMGPPPVSPDFWINLVTRLPAGSVGVCCMGGHGRTGTALVAMLMCDTGKGAESATRWIRKNYCEKAVESESQERYLLTLEKRLDK